MKPGSYCLLCQALNCLHGNRVPHLEPRQVDIARAMLSPAHHGYKEIAKALGMTEGTLKVYLSRIYDRMKWPEGYGNMRILTLWALAHAESLGVARPTAADFPPVQIPGIDLRAA